MRTLIVWLVGSLPVLALDDPRLGGPRTYSTPSPNDEYHFVMIAPRPTNPDRHLKPEQSPHEEELYRKYSATGSGLYRKGSTTPLFTVDWYSYRVFPADDGRHFVRYHGEFPLTERFPAGVRLAEEIVARQTAEPAISLYDGPRMLKMYTVNDVVRNVAGLPHSLQHVLWSAGGIMTADGKQFCLMTQDSRQIFFDLATGEIALERDAGLANTEVWVVRVSLALTGFAGLGILFAYWWHGRLGRSKSAGQSPV